MTTRRLPSGFDCTMIPIVAGRESNISCSGGSAESFLSSSSVSFRSCSPRSLIIFQNVARDLGNVRIGRSLKNQPTTRGNRRSELLPKRHDDYATNRELLRVRVSRPKSHAGLNKRDGNEKAG